jgi:predicted DNA-binding transcriptional regulator AlpA
MGRTLDRPPPDIPNDLERPEVIAAELKIARKTLDNMRTRGEGPPYVRILRAVRYSRSEVAEWIANQR